MQDSVPYGSSASERALMARVLAFLFLAGGTLVLVTLLVPHSRSTDDFAVAVVVGLAFTVVAPLLAGAERVPIGALKALLALGSVLITTCVVSGGDSATAYPFMYACVALYAYSFLTMRAAAVQVALSAVLYGVGLALQDATPVPGIHWLLVIGPVVVGGVLLGRVTAAAREHTADLEAISQMGGGVPDVAEFASATCRSLQRSAQADAVVMFEPDADGDGLRVVARVGSAEAALMLESRCARAALDRCYVRSERQSIEREPGTAGRHVLWGRLVGLAQPVLRDGRAAAVLAISWTSPRWSLSERVSHAALLFAAEASVGLERAERLSQDRERQALEINDNIVQGLVVAKYLAQRGDIDAAIQAIDETLGRARRLITDQLDAVTPIGRSLRPGDLARAEASSVSVGDELDPEPV